MRRARIAEGKDKSGHTIYVVYGEDGEQDERVIGSAPDYQTALQEILEPFRDGPKRKVTKRWTK
jgi:hypothetical protein